MREGLTVAIRKKVPMFRKRGGGAGASATTDLTMPVMFYSNPGLINLIVAAWNNEDFTMPDGSHVPLRDTLLARHPATHLPTQAAKVAAKAAVNSHAGLDLKSVVVISEAEHDDDYTMQDDDEVVFVLPNYTRPNTAPPYATNPIPPTILETARLLMACTPNGI